MQYTSSSMMAVFLSLSFCVTSICAQTPPGGPATIGERDFPATVKFEDWSDDSSVQTYTYELLVQTGGVGIGLGVLFSIFMLFHLMCWGYCCECCRCFCFRKERLRSKSCWQQKYRICWLLLASLIIIIGIAGILLVFISSSTLYTNLDGLFDNVIKLLQDGEDFYCVGSVPATLRSGTSLEQIKADNGGTYGVLAKCSGSSVGKFLHTSLTNMNQTFESVINLIDTTQTIITAMNSTINAIDNSTTQCLSINATVYVLYNQSTFIKSHLDTIHGSGNFTNVLPASASIPSVDQQDLIAPNSTRSYLVKAKNSLVTARNNILPTITYDLDVETRKSVDESWNSIYTSLINVGNSLLKQVKANVDMESDAEDGRDSATSTESWGQYVMAAVFAVSVVCLIIMFIGYTPCKKRWPMCCGAYMVFFFFAWLCFILGIFMLLSMIVYDSCGCDGTYTSAGCITMRTTIRTNSKYNFTINNVTANLAETIDKIITCPERTTANGLYDYSADSNFIDIFGLRNAFNYTDDVNDTIAELQQAKSTMNVTTELNQAISQIDTAKSGIALVAVGRYYNFTQDHSKYVYTSSQLANPTNDPTYYPSHTPASVKSENKIRVAELTGVNRDMETQRDLLEIYKFEFNTSCNNIVTDANLIDSSVNASRVAIDNATLQIEGFVGFIATINEYTPCGWIGNAYENIVVGDYCENLFVLLDGTAVGGILCMASMVAGFFLITIFKDCVEFHHSDKLQRIDPGDGRVGQDSKVGGIELVSAERAGKGADGEDIAVSGGITAEPNSPDFEQVTTKVACDPSPIGETVDDGRAPI
mmetsp:Transcript_26058/g.41937  ORF Transcript_26058/g.41937 Transcript_26058/m.41937 type:complete len:817 (+) Transcript_26058:106-2556(+)